MDFPAQWSVELTHFGRKSGKPFELRVWYVVLDGDLWVGTQDTTRNWVRNLRAAGRAELDFGDGSATYRCEEARGAHEQQRFAKAILAKHPIAGRIINAMARGKTSCCFRLVADS
jgi:deazaflavin-dependent oxidoreductase (nitroreductase family)